MKPPEVPRRVFSRALPAFSRSTNLPGTISCCADRTWAAGRRDWLEAAGTFRGSWRLDRSESGVSGTFTSRVAFWEEEQCGRFSPGVPNLLAALGHVGRIVLGRPCNTLRLTLAEQL